MATSDISYGKGSSKKPNHQPHGHCLRKRHCSTTLLSKTMEIGLMMTKTMVCLNVKETIFFVTLLAGVVKREVSVHFVFPKTLGGRLLMEAVGRLPAGTPVAV